MTAGDAEGALQLTVIPPWLRRAVTLVGVPGAEKVTAAGVSSMFGVAEITPEAMTGTHKMAALITATDRRIRIMMSMVLRNRGTGCTAAVSDHSNAVCDPGWLLFSVPFFVKRTQLVFAAFLAVAAALFGIGAMQASAFASIHGQFPGIVSSELEPAEASVSILMIGLSGVDLTQGTFGATFYLGIRCTTECDAKNWDFINSTALKSEVTSEEPGLTWWRVTGTFVFQPDLRLYPFDTQELTIVMEHKDLNTREMIYIPNSSQSEVGPDVGVPGWNVEPFSFTVEEQEYASLGEAFSSLAFTIPIGRSTLASITKYYLPLFVFILLGTASLMISRTDMWLRIGGPALIGLTIFYLASASRVANVGYLTVWDVSILIGYIALGLVVFAGMLGSHMYNEQAFEGPGGEAKLKRFRFGFLWAVIIVVAVGSVGIIGVASFT